MDECPWGLDLRSGVAGPAARWGRHARRGAKRARRKDHRTATTAGRPANAARLPMTSSRAARSEGCTPDTDSSGSGAAGDAGESPPSTPCSDAALFAEARGRGGCTGSPFARQEGGNPASAVHSEPQPDCVGGFCATVPLRTCGAPFMADAAHGGSAAAADCGETGTIAPALLSAGSHGDGCLQRAAKGSDLVAQPISPQGYPVPGAGSTHRRAQGAALPAEHCWAGFHGTAPVPGTCQASAEPEGMSASDTAVRREAQDRSFRPGAGFAPGPREAPGSTESCEALSRHTPLPPPRVLLARDPAADACRVYHGAPLSGTAPPEGQGPGTGGQTLGREAAGWPGSEPAFATSFSRCGAGESSADWPVPGLARNPLGGLPAPLSASGAGECGYFAASAACDRALGADGKGGPREASGAGNQAGGGADPPADLRPPIPAPAGILAASSWSERFRSRAMGHGMPSAQDRDLPSIDQDDLPEEQRGSNWPGPRCRGGSGQDPLWAQPCQGGEQLRAWNPSMARCRDLPPLQNSARKPERLPAQGAFSAADAACPTALEHPRAGSANEAFQSAGTALPRSISCSAPLRERDFVPAQHGCHDAAAGTPPLSRSDAPDRRSLTCVELPWPASPRGCASPPSGWWCPSEQLPRASTGESAHGYQATGGAALRDPAVHLGWSPEDPLPGGAARLPPRARSVLSAEVCEALEGKIRLGCPRLQLLNVRALQCLGTLGTDDALRLVGGVWPGILAGVSDVSEWVVDQCLARHYGTGRVVRQPRGHRPA